MNKYPLRLFFFSGFYNTIHDDVFNQEEEMILEDYPGRSWNDFNWTIDYEGYCKRYVWAVNSETGLDLEFRNVWSPREYNFATDEIYCYIDEEDLKNISSSLNSETLKNIIKQRFTSRDGFSSFYSNSLDVWKEKEVEAWDEIELGTLLDAWLIENQLNDDDALDYYCYDYCQGNGQYVDYEKRWDEEEEIYEKVLAKKQKEEEDELREKEVNLLEKWKKSVLGQII